MPRLVFIHRIDENIGDLLSGPYRYWYWGEHDVIDILDIDRIATIEAGAHIVIGGGGLLMPYFDDFLTRVLARFPSRVVWWGVGDRWIQNVEAGYLSPEEAQHPMDRYCFPTGHLVGVRMMGTSYPYLPCCSCKHIAEFRRSHSGRNGSGVAVFEHEAVKIDVDPSIPKLVNTKCTVDEAIAFIDSCRCLITNSYHGLYWGRLLDKAVVCVPFSCSSYHHDWGLYYASPAMLRGGFEKVVERAMRLSGESAQPFGAFLESCLNLNDAFYRTAREYLDS